MERTGSSARALSSPPPGILSYDVSAAAVAAASARTAALLGAGPEQTAAAVEKAVESFFRTLRKQEPTTGRTLYFDLYQDDEEEELTCEPSGASDRTTPTATSQPSGHSGVRSIPSPWNSTCSGGSASQHTPQAFAAGEQFGSPRCGDHETPAESTAGLHWGARSLLSGFGKMEQTGRCSSQPLGGGRPPPAPAWAASSSGFHTDGPPRVLLQGSPSGLQLRPRSRPTPERYGKLPRVRGVRASQLLDGALTSAFEM